MGHTQGATGLTITIRAMIVLAWSLSLPDLWASQTPSLQLRTEETPLGYTVARVPTEVWQLIFRELPVRTLLRTSCVGRKFQELSTQHINAYLTPLHLDTLQNPNVPRWKLLQILSSQEFVSQFLGLEEKFPRHADTEYAIAYHGYYFLSAAPLQALWDLPDLGYEASIFFKLQKLRSAYIGLANRQPNTPRELLALYPEAQRVYQTLKNFVDAFLDLKALSKKSYPLSLIKAFYVTRNGPNYRGLQGFTQYNSAESRWEDNITLTYTDLKTQYPALYRMTSFFRPLSPEAAATSPPPTEYFKELVDLVTQSNVSLDTVTLDIAGLLQQRKDAYSQGLQLRSMVYIQNDPALSTLNPTAQQATAPKDLLEEILNPLNGHLPETRQNAMLAMYGALRHKKIASSQTPSEFLIACLKSRDAPQRLSALFATHAVLFYGMHTFSSAEFLTEPLVKALLDLMNDPLPEIAFATTQILYEDIERYAQLGLQRRGPYRSDLHAAATTPTAKNTLDLRSIPNNPSSTPQHLKDTIQYCQPRLDQLTTPVFHWLYSNRTADRIPAHVLSTFDKETVTLLQEFSLQLQQHANPAAQKLGVRLRYALSRLTDEVQPHLEQTLKHARGGAFQEALHLWLMTNINMAILTPQAITTYALDFYRLLRSLSEGATDAQGTP